MGVLKKHVLNGAVGRLKLMRAGYLNQLAGFGNPVKLVFWEIVRLIPGKAYQEQDSFTSLV